MVDEKMCEVSVDDADCKIKCFNLVILLYAKLFDELDNMLSFIFGNVDSRTLIAFRIVANGNLFSKHCLV